VNPLAVYADDYTRGLHWRRQGGNTTPAGQLAVTRASGIFLPDSAGAVRTLGNNALPRTDRGLYANGQVASKTTARNNNLPALVTPTDSASFVAATSGIGVLSASTVAGALYGIVDLTAEVEAAGLAEPVGNGRVFCIDNTAGASNAQVLFSGAVGNTNGHTVQVFVKGTGNMAYGLSSGFGPTFSVPADWTRLSKQQTPVAGTNVFGLYAAPGAVVYFILFAMAETSFLPDPVLLSPSYTLFASDIRAVQGIRPSNGQPEPFPGWEAAGLDDGFTFLLRHEGRFRAASNRRLAGINGSSGFTRIETSSNGLQFRVAGSDGTNNSIRANGDIAGGPMLSAFTMLSDGSVSLARSGVGIVSSGTIPYPVSPETLSVGATISINPWNDWIYELQVCKPLSNAELLAWVNA
jgi:hypothetical protein